MDGQPTIPPAGGSGKAVARAAIRELPARGPGFGRIAAAILLVAGCTSVAQMKAAYDAGDTSQLDKLIAIAARPDYPYATRRAAVRALGEIADPRSLDPLVGILGEFDQRTTLKEEAVVALGRIGDPAAVAPIGRLLDRSLSDPNAELRMAALPVLGQLGGAEAAGILLNALSYYDALMRRDEMGPYRGVFSGEEQSLADLRDSLRTPADRRAMSLGALEGEGMPTSGLFGTDPGLALAPEKDTTPEERTLVHQSLVRVGAAAVGPIEEYLGKRDTSVSLRNELAEILDKIRAAGSGSPAPSG